VNGLARSWLDRILVSTEWEEIWLGSRNYVLERIILDQCALLLKLIQIEWEHIPFRVLDMWHTQWF